MMREPIILDKLLDRALQESDITPDVRNCARERTQSIKRGMGSRRFITFRITAPASYI